MADVEGSVAEMVIRGVEAVRARRGEEGVRLLEAALVAAPQLRPSFAQEYARAIEAWALDAEWDVGVSRWLRGTTFWPENGYVLLSLGRGASSAGHDVEARAAFFAAATRLGGDETAAALAIECAGRATARLVEAWHWRMVNDLDRNIAFIAALESVATRKTVVDVGTGAGLLALAALRAGASRVVACERSRALADVARRSLGSTTVEVFEGDSSTLEGSFDVAVAEVFDAALFGEGALRTLRDAARLATRVIPAKVTLCAAAAHAPKLKKRFVARAGRAAEPYDVACADDVVAWVSNVARWEDVVATGGGNFGHRQVARLDCRSPDVLVAWFELDLLGDGAIVLSTAPNAFASRDHYRGTSWQQAVFEARGDVVTSISARLVDGDDVLALDLVPVRDDLRPSRGLLTLAETERANDARWREAYRDAVCGHVLEVGFGCEAASPLRGLSSATVTRCGSGVDADDAVGPGADLAALCCCEEPPKCRRFEGLVHSFIDPSGHVRAGALADVDLAREHLLLGDTPSFKLAPASATAWGIAVQAPALAATHYVNRHATVGLDMTALDDYATPHARDIEILGLNGDELRARPAIQAVLTEPVRLVRIDMQQQQQQQQHPVVEKEADDHAWLFRPRRGPIEERAAMPATSQTRARRAGVAHAILFWWHLDFDPFDTTTKQGGRRRRRLSTVPTLDELFQRDGGDAADSAKGGSAHWRAAAFILNRGAGIALACGDQLALRTALRHSHVHVDSIAVTRAKSSSSARSTSSH
ncbi:hypothetical protein CTAYLR_009612 [Chrysophaeum taylorii]|uniref:Methyltransferase domain-containing protein n=1 Tax=Chrysophaeum taylorii TaxID=2483200 RepID=A0AAD7UPQ2_9STRA|nr:hypothetical protein CTAYLR_009612 [Chrysophaeum taylorii]